jgi:hypothetical protein
MEAGSRAAVLRVNMTVARIALAALAFLVSALAVPVLGRAHPTGTLIAAFVTRSEILLCSDGRVVNSATRETVRDDWPKVHRLTDQAGLLTAGRDLPRLRDQFAAKLGSQRLEQVSAIATVLRGALEAEWSAIATSSGQTPAGRAFAVVAGFDADRTARLFYMDSASRPAFLLQPVSLFGAGQELEIFAISSNLDANEDVSSLLVRRLDALARQQPAPDRRGLMLSAFEAAKQELGARNRTIGGRTFGAVITRGGRYEAVR